MLHGLAPLYSQEELMFDSEFADIIKITKLPETAVFITREGSAVLADQFFVVHFYIF